MLDQRRRHADRPHQVCRDRGDHQRIVDLTGGRGELHDAGVIDEDVEVGMLGDQLRRHLVDARRIGDVELNKRENKPGLHMPFSLNPIGTLSRRHLAQFVSVIDTKSAG